MKDPIWKKIKRTLVKIAVLKNWHKVVLPETKFPYKQEMVARLRNGLSFHMKSNSFDLPILYGIFWDDIYDLSEIKNIKKPTILDIGGHISMFAVYAAFNLQEPRIYSFEPDPENIKLFNENTSLNRVDRYITLAESAVCKEKGERNMYINRSNTSMNNMFQPKASRGMTDSIHITCTTLSDIILNNKVDKFDYAKIDCEGAEYEILMNASDDVLMKLPIMVIEWHANTANKPEDLVAFLEKKGYKTSFQKKPRIITAIRINA